MFCTFTFDRGLRFWSGLLIEIHRGCWGFHMGLCFAGHLERPGRIAWFCFADFWNHPKPTSESSYKVLQILQVSLLPQSYSNLKGLLETSDGYDRSGIHHVLLSPQLPINQSTLNQNNTTPKPIAGPRSPPSPSRAPSTAPPARLAQTRAHAGGRAAGHGRGPRRPPSSCPGPQKAQAEGAQNTKNLLGLLEVSFEINSFGRFPSVFSGVFSSGTKVQKMNQRAGEAEDVKFGEKETLPSACFVSLWNQWAQGGPTGPATCKARPNVQTSRAKRKDSAILSCLLYQGRPPAKGLSAGEHQVGHVDTHQDGAIGIRELAEGWHQNEDNHQDQSATHPQHTFIDSCHVLANGLATMLKLIDHPRQGHG